MFLYDKEININYDNSKPYPFCLAYSLEKDLEDLGPVEDWQVEYKWDGIRGQIVKRNNEVFIWSRGEELVTEQFPELVSIVSKFKDDFVLDGEILAIKDQAVLLFNDLQKRLNRKNVTKQLMEDVPVGFYVYDILEFNNKDIRKSALKDRRQILEELFKTEAITSDFFKLSQRISFKHWNELDAIRNEARQFNSEGLMLKQKASSYHVGRKKGDWWKWKV